MDAGLDFSRQEITGDEPYSTWALWPNLCLVSPAPDRAPHEAQQPSHCLERTDTCYPPEFKSEKFQAAKSLFAESFNCENILLVENVQRGLVNHGYDQGRYVVDGAGSWF